MKVFDGNIYGGQDESTPRPERIGPGQAVEAFRDAIEAAGLGRPEILPNTDKIQRFATPDDRGGKESGWYILYLDDNPAGSFGSWKHDVNETWSARAKFECSEEELRTTQARVERAKALRAAEKIRVNAEAAQLAADLWNAAAEADDTHPYLQRKHVKAHGLRLGRDGELLVPMWTKDGYISSLERIFDNGDKLFLTGGAKAGNYFWIPGDQRRVYVAEGYATGASVHEATGSAVAVAFDAGNLEAVAMAVKAVLPMVEVVIAADDDRWTHLPDGTPYNPGQVKAKAAADAVGGKVLTPRFRSLDGRPTDWNDLHVREGLDDVAAQLGTAGPGVRIFAWGLEAYDGTPPDYEWTVERLVPKGAATLLAAMGETGKGILSLDLALEIAGGGQGVLDFNDSAGWLGHKVLARGTAVIFTAEDDQNEIHRRIRNLDPDGARTRRAAGKLFVIPLPNAGGPFPVVTTGKHGPETTPQYHNIKQQLDKFDDLALVIFDPLANFVAADVNADPMAGAYVTGLMSSLASDTGAAVIVAHHMRKPSSPITSPEGAREAIRGTTALVDGMRCALGIWPVEAKRAQSICKRLGIVHGRNIVFQSAVVKSNGPADRDVVTLVREDGGLLRSRDADIRSTAPDRAEVLEFLLEDIAKAARSGRPFQKASAAYGVHARQEELCSEVREYSTGKHTLQELVQELLDSGRIRTCGWKSTPAKWLDVPEGPFGMGVGEIAQGFCEDEKVQ